MHPKFGHSRGTVSAFLGLLLVHAGLVAWSAWRHSPTVDEVEHLVAGVSHVELARFDLYRVNPPLVRTVAALPVVLARPALDWRQYTTAATLRPDCNLSTDFVRANGQRIGWLTTLGRWGCIPFCLLGAAVSCLWARELFGWRSGWMAITLWCFCPYVLAHGSLMTPDAHAAAAGLAAGWTFWRWLCVPHWKRSAVAGIALGLAELTKFTLVVFYPAWLMAWLLYRLPERRTLRPADWTRQAAMLLGIIALSFVVINLGYACEEPLRPLGEYRFRSRALTGIASPDEVPDEGANRFQGTWLGKLPVPLPQNYLQGIDTQRSDFEGGMRSYLGDQWRTDGGWWYFYLVALAVKIPLGTWTLILLAAAASLAGKRGDRGSGRDQAVLLLPAAAILALVSSQTGFTLHSRYALPLVPFLYVWASQIARPASPPFVPWGVAARLALGWSVASSLVVYPHSLAYFNELAGGPAGGRRWLADSNIAWGQDLFFLQRWLGDHPEARPLHMAISYSSLNPGVLGIDFTWPRVGPASPPPPPGVPGAELGPHPGWYAIDVNFLHGIPQLPLGEDAVQLRAAREGCNYRYFQRFRPVAMAGYSIYLYHVTLEDANRVRRQLGLEDLTPAGYRAATTMGR